MGHKYYIINKPFNMVSQFVSPDPVGLLGDLNYSFPPGIHAVGRLDSHSEGLLILTTDKRVTRLLFQGAQPHQRTYLVQVSGIVTETELEQLRNGISIRVKGGDFWRTTPCEVVLAPETTYPHVPPGRAPVFAPFTWMLITLTEGKFHQVRKMMAAIHHRCLRLIRMSIDGLELGSLAPGEVRDLDATQFFAAIGITERPGE